jgi:hypothetical protein
MLCQVVPMMRGSAMTVTAADASSSGTTSRTHAVTTTRTHGRSAHFNAIVALAMFGIWSAVRWDGLLRRPAQDRCWR